MVNFIKLEKSLEAALYVRTSPLERLRENRGVQILPQDPLPYIQVTDHPTGVSLEDWTVIVKTRCGEVLGDISNYFMVNEVFADDNGQPQIVWQLKAIPKDFGWQLIYLEITQAVGEMFYSSLFQITNLYKERTARVDYRMEEYEPMRSTRLQMYFRQYINKDQLTTYYEDSTETTVTVAYQSATPEFWITDDFHNTRMRDLRNMLRCHYKYVDLRRCHLFEAFEIPKLKQTENFAQVDFLLSFDSETYDPLYVPTVPPPVVETLQMFVKVLRRTDGVNQNRYSTMAITFTQDLPVGAQLGFDVNDSGGSWGTPTTSTYIYNWVNLRNSAFQVTAGTPTGTPGERAAINFQSAFSIDFGAQFTVTRDGNTVTIKAQSIYSNKEFYVNGIFAPYVNYPGLQFDIKNNQGGVYSAQIRWNITDSFTVVNENNSWVRFNNGFDLTTGFENVAQTASIITATSTPVLGINEANPTSVNIDDFTIVVSSAAQGISKNYKFISDPQTGVMPLSFTEADITNGIEREVTANITQ